MSAALMLALLLQVFSVALLRMFLGKTWLRRPVVVLVLVSVVTQGVTQVMLLAPSLSAQDAYRNGLAPRFPSEACELLSACTLSFVIAYLMARPERSVPGGSRPEGDLAAGLDWRWLAAAAVPLAVLTYAGKGYNANLGAQAGLGVSLAVSFLLLTVTAAAAAFVLRHGARWTLGALLAQSAVLAAAGERTPVIACGVALVLVLAHAGVRIPKGQVAAGAVLVAVAVLAVTGSRAASGRQVYYSDSGASGRFSALSSGIAAAGSTGSLAAQAATRLDDVSFTAAILQARSLGYPRLPASYVPGSLIEVVPSALYPSKLSHANALAPAQLEINDLGLQQVNYLPGFAGTYAGFLPPWALIAVMALVGWAFGLGERRLLAACTPVRLILLAGAAEAAFVLEAGLAAMLVTLRSAVVLAVAVRVLAALRAHRARRPPPVPGYGQRAHW